MPTSIAVEGSPISALLGRAVLATCYRISMKGGHQAQSLVLRLADARISRCSGKPKEFVMQWLYDLARRCMT